MVSLSHYLTLAAVLFTVGAIGVVVRRNVLTILMSIELMLNAANLTFVAFSRFPLVQNGEVPALGGHASAVFVIATAAAEAAVGLAILIAVFRKRQTTHVDELTLLRDRPYEPEPLVAAPAPAAHADTAHKAEAH
jgi:NADH-quinone oxidoreductase subunit K